MSTMRDELIAQIKQTVARSITDDFLEQIRQDFLRELEDGLEDRLAQKLQHDLSEEYEEEQGKLYYFEDNDPNRNQLNRIESDVAALKEYIAKELADMKRQYGEINADYYARLSAHVMENLRNDIGNLIEAKVTPLLDERIKHIINNEII